MAPLSLEGDTLGEKHKHFNKLVHDAVANKQINLSKINYDDSDLHNLLKIHTACKTNNVDYIIEVLKCDDMLYVSTAIKHSTWLVTEQAHAHIVNPEYLYTQLFPHMLSRAINKLLLHIRLNLKDEKRVEEFYDYYKDTFSFAVAEKWLLNCSIPFVENVLQKESNITYETYKRLCKRSVKFLPYYTKVQNDWRALRAVKFLMKSNIEECLNFLDAIESYYVLTFGKKHTKLILKKYPERILDNLKKYTGSVDLSILAKYIKKEDIKDFLLKHARNDNTKHYFTNYANIKHFIKNMPQEDRFSFVKNMYIDKIGSQPPPTDGIEADDIACLPSCMSNTYEWYQYAPFNVALNELKKLIRAESSPAERCAMLSVLVKCTRTNLHDAKTVLQYYYDKHRNEPFKFKIQFINNFISKIPTHEFDSETWSILDKLFHSLEVYIESNNDVQQCLQTIVVYKVLHNENIPDIIQTKIKFDTFEKFYKILKEGQRNQLLQYLITSISKKINSKTVVTESDFDSSLSLLDNALQLLASWKKDIKDYTFLNETIQELIKIKKLNSWKTDLSSLYDINKSWRRHLFEESIALCPSERVCLNALKHKPQLLKRHIEEVNALRKNDDVSLTHLLGKLRIYWPYSLAQEWTEAYRNNLNESTAHKSSIKGLTLLLPQAQIIDLTKKHVPKEFKIEWSEINQMELSLSKNIAKQLYIARPLIPLDVVLWYAKGDYLQYTVPSLNAIIHNISKVQSRAQISKLLEAPVSLQKYGLNLAFEKLEFAELKSLFSDIWKTTKNLTIRTHLFTHTYNMLCNVKEPTVANDLWEVLNTFIDNLTANENKSIFSKLGNVKKVHISVRGAFFMKSYVFLGSLPPGINCEKQKDDLIRYSPIIMDLLDTDFVAEKILKPIEPKISTPNCMYISSMSSYILHGKTEEEQCDRFRRVLLPALEHALASWDLIKNDTYVIKLNIDELFQTLTFDFRKFLCFKKIVVPSKLFSEIKSFMDQKMTHEEHYIRRTSWKLITEYAKLVAEYQDMLSDTRLDNIPASSIENNWLPDDADRVWEAMHIKLSPKLGPIIVKYLKEDTEKYFPTICWLFSKALNKMFSNLSFNNILTKMETLKYMVLDEDFIPSYIVVCDELPCYGDEKDRKKRVEIRNILSAHPSQEVQMHYYKAFDDLPDVI